MKQFDNKTRREHGPPVGGGPWPAWIPWRSKIINCFFRRKNSSAQRFRFERDRRAFLFSYDLLRRALTRSFQLFVPRIDFHEAPNGRLEIDQPSVLPWPRFQHLSHHWISRLCLTAADARQVEDAFLAKLATLEATGEEYRPVGTEPRD
jgi:hypothetical protein